MKNYLKNISLTILTMFILILPMLVLAAENTTTIENPLKNADTLSGLIKTILTGVIKIGIPIITLAIIYSGFLFVSAQGNSEKLGEAKKALLYTLIGAAILLGSWAIAQLVSDTVLAL